MKNLLLLLFALNTYAFIAIPIESKQLLVVSTDGFDNNQAVLHTYERSNTTWKEVFAPRTVNLGRNGLAWGEGILSFKHAKDEPLKYEGDGKSPAGLFQLESFFGYEDQHFRFPYLQVDVESLCIDDISSHHYNQIIQSKESETFKSFEYMKRKDKLYRLGIVVGHNQKAIKKRGSCIFIHIQKAEAAPTSGCTSMPEEQLNEVMQWLDVDKKPLLLQVPDVYLKDGFH